MVVTVGGTWSEGDAAAWFRPSSVWSANARNAGLAFLDETEPFEWSTSLAISAHDPNWRTAGLSLKWYCGDKYEQRQPGNILDLVLVAHSHGGQVVAYALAAGLHVKRIVTVGTPVRSDMQDIWTAARKNIAEDWTHIWTEEVVRPLDPDAQPYQLLGSLPSVPLERTFFQASRNVQIDPPTTHHGLMWPQLWNDHALWDYLR